MTLKKTTNVDTLICLNLDMAAINSKIRKFRELKPLLIKQLLFSAISLGSNVPKKPLMHYLWRSFVRADNWQYRNVLTRN